MQDKACGQLSQVTKWFLFAKM